MDIRTNMKIQINDEIRNATQEEKVAIDKAIQEAQDLTVIEQNKKLAVISAFNKLVALGLTENEATAITGFKPEIE